LEPIPQRRRDSIVCRGKGLSSDVLPRRGQRRCGLEPFPVRPHRLEAPPRSQRHTPAQALRKAAPQLSADQSAEGVECAEAGGCMYCPLSPLEAMEEMSEEPLMPASVGIHEPSGPITLGYAWTHQNTGSHWWS